MQIRTKSALCAAAIGACLGVVGQIDAAPITPGNLVIFRAGTGAAALGGAATSAFLDEYTPGGSLVQSITIPDTGASALTVTGNATTEGIISRSQDTSLLVFSGYRANAAATGQTATNKVIGTLDSSGLVSTLTEVSDAGTVTARSATTVNGLNYYLSTSANVRFVPVPGGVGTSTSIDARNSRQVNLADNILYASNGSTAITAKVQHYGTLPVGTTAPTPVVTLALADAVNGFFLADLNPGVAGSDTVYALSTVENLLRKYTFDGVSWAANGSIPASSTQNLSGVVSGSSVTLYLTSGTGLFAYTDSSGVGGALSGTLGAAVATAGTNTAFRGIGVFIPEPGAVGLVLTGAVLALRRRQRT
jgi:hypothetical protein